MKKIKFLALILLLGVFGFGINWAISKSDNSVRETRKKVDTRIDNSHYWVDMAEKGYIEFNPDVKSKLGNYTGSKIVSFSVATEDSPDVPVTEVNSTQSENSVFVDPNDPATVLNSNNSTENPVGGLYGANDFYSNNSGETWDGEVEGAGGPNSGDPTTSIGLNGRWYVNFIDSPGGMGISYSDNQGASWTPSSVAPNPGQLADKNHMWIDNTPASPYEGNVYIAWTNFGGSDDTQIAISTSDDDGETWSTNNNISADVNAGSHNQGVNIGVGPDGEVYAIWAIYDGWPTDETAIGMAKSFDGGVTWEPATRVITNIRGIRTTGTSKNMRVNSFPVCVVDCSDGSDRGTVYITWSNIGTPGVNLGSDIDVYVAKSADQGTSWTEPLKVNQDEAGLGHEHYFPWITCDPSNGALSVIFYDDRNVGSNELETFCANSFDGGESWEDFKVSDVSFTPSPIPGLADGYFGDYLGIIAQNGIVYPVWTDNRTGTAMTYCSPYETNSLSRPKNLEGIITFETGDCDLIWSYEEAENFSNFNIYRNGEFLAETTDTTFVDNLPTYGIYTYQVTAKYTDNEESGAARTVEQWGDAHIAVSPLAIYEELLIDSISTKQFMVVNTGQLDLTYNISSFIPTNKAPLDYCVASGGGDEYISNVEVGDITNPSGSDNYVDYTDLSTTMQIGESYEITIENGNPYAADQCGIWVDWDQNGEFDEEIVIESSGTGPYIGTITPPEGSATGETRMRVRIMYSGNLDPCGQTSYGEVEDYTIFVQGWYKITPTAGVVTPNDTAYIDVIFDSHNMEIGLYNATAAIESNDPDVDDINVDLTLLIKNMIAKVSASNDAICFGDEVIISSEIFGTPDTTIYTWTSVPAGYENDTSVITVTPQVPTWYFLTVDDNAGSYSADSIFINVYELPVVALGADTSICSSLTWTLDAGNEGSEYLWSNGETTQTIIVDTVGFGFGNQEIYVDVYNENECVSADTINIDFKDCTGINELASNVDVNIFPNPSNGKYNVVFSSNMSFNVNVLIVSNTGNVVYNKSNILLNGKTTINLDISNNASGNYQLIVKSNKGIISKKLIKN